MPTRHLRTSLLSLPVGVVILGVLLGGVTLLAEPSRRDGERQKPDTKGPGKKRTEDEDDDPKPIKRKIVDVDHTADKPTPKRPVVADLNTLAAEATNKRVRALYENLAVPHDEVSLKGTTGVTSSGEKRVGGVFRVEPLPEYIGDVKDLKKKLTLHFIDKDGKRSKTDTPGLREYVAVRHYEQLAIDDVRNFLKISPDDSLSRLDQLLAAEQTLAAVLRFHESARERKIRQGSDWEKVEDPLRAEVLRVLVLQLDDLADRKLWDMAFALTRRLTDTHNRPKEIAQYADSLAALLQKALDDPTFAPERLRDARVRLRQIQQRFPDAKVLEPLSRKLRDQAQALLNDAKNLVKAEKRADALALLQQAEETWPDLPGLRAYRIQIDGTYQILRVNQAQLPKYLSPGRAVTEAERRAVDLLFESLVELAPDDGEAMSYHPSLAEGRIQVVHLGRQFRLPRNVLWSDGKTEMTAADLRFTVERLRHGEGGKGDSAWRDATTGRCAAWGDLIEDVVVSADPYRVRLVLRQGFLDSLAAMSFKVLPRGSASHTEAFALKPVGSGPFTFAGTNSEAGRPYVSLLANLTYGTRRGKRELPRVKEVRLFDFPDPVSALKNKQVDLAFDLTAAQAAALGGDASIVVPLPSDKTPNRRIYFLAVNHRRPSLGDANLRIALALAINRERLLDAHFRKGIGRKVHRALDGPYPARSWARDPLIVGQADKTSIDPFDPDLAGTKWKQAKGKLGIKDLRLTLKYPSGDKILADAIGDLCREVGKTLEGVTLVAEGCSPHNLRDDVERTHDFDLAYYYYDFPDESLWLQPLLGPSGRGGSENYLGYNGTLVGKIQTAAMLRNIAEVKKETKQIHAQFLRSDMPFVPLWQLDALYAHRKDRIEMPPLEPLHPFARADQWRVTSN